MSTFRALISAVCGRFAATARVWRHGAATAPTRPSVSLPGGSLDRPAIGTTVERAVVQIDGWALTAAGPCSRVELTADGRPLGRARLGDARPDVGEATGLPAGGLSGFHLSIDVAELSWVRPGDQLEIAAYAVGIDGDTFALPPLMVSVAGAPVSVSRRHRPRPVRSRPSPELELLVCTHELGYGGAQLLLAELLRRICELAPVGGLVLSPSDGPTAEALEQLGFDVHVTSEFPVWSEHEYEGRLEELVAWAGERRFDVALTNTMVSFPGADLSARLGLPLVWAIHESYSLPALWATYGSRLDPAVQKRGEAALGGASAAVFTADATRSLYEPYVPGLRCETLRYGIDVDALDEWRAGFDRTAERREQRIPADALVILCMGTIEPRKAQTQLIHAFAQVAERHPRALLLIVGSRSDHFARVAHQAVALHGLQDRVRIEPVVPDPRPSYAIADLLVSASDLESTPRSMLEAMALRLPVLSTNVFGIPELIKDERTGWLFEPRDVGALADALDRVLGLESGSRADVAQRARTMVDTGYRSEICSREWLRVLQEAAAGQGAAAGGGRVNGRGSVRG